jgi:hypothetical protein
MELDPRSGLDSQIGSIRERFLEACVDEEAAIEFVRISRVELREMLDWLKRHHAELPKRLGLPALAHPGRSFPESIREGQFNGLDERLLVGKKLLSLDIFDTCLVRAVTDPYTVFEWVGLLLEKRTCLSASEFAQVRRDTENLLRAKELASGEREDVTLPGIYEAIGKALGWDAGRIRKAMQTELACERALLHPVEQVRAYAMVALSRGMDIVYTSEMYLQGSDLKVILNENGFPVENSRVLTSGETGKSKGTGNLYRKLIQEYSAESVIHIGDNPSTDLEIPKSLGIDCIHVQTPRIAYTKLLEAGLATLLDKEDHDSGYWEKFGYRVAGPLHLLYAIYIYRNCFQNRIDNVHFLSRDGWFVKSAFDRLQLAWGPVANSNYVYASREMLGIAAMDTIDAEDWEFILKPSPLLRTRDVFERLRIPEDVYTSLLKSSNLPGKDELLCHHWGYRDPSYKAALYHAVCAGLPHFLEYRKEHADCTRAYLQEIGIFSQDSLFVDLGWSGSSARAIQRMAKPGEVPQGIYFALFQKPDKGVCTYIPAGSQPNGINTVLKSGIAQLEFIFGSPEPTAYGVTHENGLWKPLFRKAWSSDEVSAWRSMEIGVDRFLHAALGRFPSDPGGETHVLVERILRSCIFRPDTEDLVAWSKITHGEGWGCDHRLRILPRLNGIPTEAFLREAYCYAPWKDGLCALEGAVNQNRASNR